MSYMLFIKVVGTPEGIVIEDGAGRPGGDLKLRVGDDVCWVNATGRTCKLMFRELQLGREEPRYKGRVWPFEGDGPGGDLDIPASGWCGRVKALGSGQGRKADYVKYDVMVTGGGPALDLDPIIIIDR
jgi:hypothetical protein